MCSDLSVGFWQVDLRKASTIQFVASSSYPVIVFGPFESPTAVLIALSHAIGDHSNFLSFIFKFINLCFNECLDDHCACMRLC